MNNPFRAKSNAPEESHITMASGLLEVTFNHATKTAFLIDQTGSSSDSLIELEKWFTAQGWFIHAISVSPSTIVRPEVTDR